MIPLRVFLVTVPLNQHLRRALTLLLRKVGGILIKQESKGPARSWRDGHIFRPPWNPAVEPALANRKEQAVRRALEGRERKKVSYPGKLSSGVERNSTTVSLEYDLQENSNVTSRLKPEKLN